MVKHFYLVTSLPILGQLGGDAPLDGPELMARLSDAGGVREVVAMVLLADDLLQREALLSGEVAEVQPAVLTPGQMANQERLPDELAGGDDVGAAGGRAVDAVWAAYFRQALDVASRQGSRFLEAWVRYEIALRNALVTARAKALGLEAAGYLVRPDLASREEDFAALLAEWSAAANPLAAQRVLDLARWHWIAQHDEWFTFSADEVAAYAARLMLLARWQRVGQLEADRQRGP